MENIQQDISALTFQHDIHRRLPPQSLRSRMPSNWQHRRNVYAPSRIHAFADTPSGYQTALHLAARGAKVYLGTRSLSKAASAISTIRQSHPTANLHVLHLDLTSLTSVAAAAQEFTSKEPQLHTLINNAGLAVTPFALTEDSYETQLQVNYLSHFLLTQRLLPLLLRTASSSPKGAVRIINVSSDAHRYFHPPGGIDFDDINLTHSRHTPWTRYGQSKLANVLHTHWLNHLYGPASKEIAGAGEEGEIWTASLHPGTVNSGVLLSMEQGANLRPLLRAAQPLLGWLGLYMTTEKGCLTSLFAAASEEFKADNSGKYLVPYGKKGKVADVVKEELARKLWEWSEGELRKKGLL